MEYWEQRWQNNQTGWDIGEPSPPLMYCINQIKDKQAKILLPGCGNAHEAAYLMQQGFNHVVLLDIAASALLMAQHKFKREIEEGRLTLIHDDFFHHHDSYDIILEQTFFCAINPDLRRLYASHASNLLKPDGVLAGVMFNCDFNGGPPFGGNIQEYYGYFQPYFKVVHFEPCLHSIAPRAGREVLINMVK
jgi:methyl halide transferase